jgi:hypothetical protein
MSCDLTTTPNPWTQLPAAAPFLLAEDAGIVEKHNSRRKEDHQFRLDTLPEPFMGPLDAPVVLLNLNPGFDPSDLPNYAPAPRASMMRKSLTHELAPDQAFYFLTDEFRDTGGWWWWTRKLKPLIDVVGFDRVRRGVQVIEYIPYKSTKFYSPRGRIPSQSYSFHLVEEALAREASVVAMRRSRDWISAVPGLAGRPPHVLNSAMNVTISPRNCPSGFGELVERLRQFT